MENIGYKLRVPSKADRKAWNELQLVFRAETERGLIAEKVLIEERKKQVRRELEVMRKRPLTTGRIEAIDKLEKELKQLIGL